MITTIIIIIYVLMCLVGFFMFFGIFRSLITKKCDTCKYCVYTNNSDEKYYCKKQNIKFYAHFDLKIKCKQYKHGKINYQL